MKKMMMKLKEAKVKAFTLIEMLVVLLVIHCILLLRQIWHKKQE